MAEEVLSIGVGMETNGIERGVKVLKSLADAGPHVERAMDGVEKAASKANASMGKLGGDSSGLNAIGRAAEDAAKKLGWYKDAQGRMRDESGRVVSAARQVEAGLAGVGRQSAQAATGMSTAFEGVASGAGGAAQAVGRLNAALALVGAGVSVWSAIDMADTWGQYAIRIQQATNSQAEYNLVMERTAASAKSTYRGLEEVRELFLQTGSSIQSMGYSLRETLDLQDSFSYLLVTNAASAERGASAIDAYSKAMMTGALDSESWQRILLAMPTVVDRISDSTGKAASEIRKLGVEGKLALGDINSALLDSLEVNKAAADAMPATVREAIGNAATGLKEFLGYSNEATGATQVLVKGLNLLGDNMEAIGIAGTAVGVVFGARMVSSIAASGVAFAASSIQAVRYQATLASMAGVSTTAAAGIGTLTAATRGLNAAMGLAGGPLGAVLAVAGLATAAFYAFGDSTEDATKELIKMGDPIDDVAEKLQAMTRAQREQSETKLLADQVESVKKADKAYEDFRASLLSTASAAGYNSKSMGELSDELDAVKAAGGDFIPIIDRISSAKYVPEGSRQELVGMVSTFDTLSQAVATAASWLDQFRNAAQGVAGGGTASEDPTKRLLAEADALIQGTKSYKSRAEAMAEVRAEGQRVETQLQALKDAGLGASDQAQALESRLVGVNERLKGMQGSGKGAAKSVDELTRAFESSIKSLTDRIAAEQLTLEVLQKYGKEAKNVTAIDREVIAAQKALAAATTTTAKARAQAILNANLELQAVERANRGIQERIDLEMQFAQVSAAATTNAFNDLKNLEEQVKQQEYANAAIGLGAKELAALEAAKYRDAAATKRRLAAEMEANPSEAAMAELYRKQADQLERMALLKENGAMQQANVDAQAEILAKWDQTSQLIGQTLSDYIMGGGKDAAQYLKRLFATLVLQPIVNYGVQGVMGALGMGASATAAAGQSGMGLLSMAQSGQSLWSAFSGSMVSTMAGGIASLGGMLGSSALSSFAAGMSGATAALAEGLAGPVISGSMSASLGAAFATALPWLAGGLALAGVWSSLFGRKLKDTGVGGEYDAASGFDGYTYKYYKGGLFRSNKTVRTDMDAETEAPIESAFDSVLSSISGFADALSIEASALDSFKYSFQFSTSGKTEAEIQEALAGVLNTAAIKATDSLNIDFSEFARGGETSIETLSRLAGSLTGVNTLFDALGQALFDASLAGGDMASQLVDLFGGLEGMQAVAGSYLDNYYTEQERVDIAMRGLTASFAQLGLTLPDSKEALRELIEAQDLTTESGRGTYAALMMLSGSFSDYAASADAMAESEAELAKAREDARQAQIDEWMNLGGLSVQSMSKGVMDALQNGEDPGAWLADHITGGFEQAMQMAALNMIMQRIMDEALAPAMEEVMTDLFGERGESTATTAEDAVLKIFDRMDAAFASVMGEGVLNLASGLDGTTPSDGMQEMLPDGMSSLDSGGGLSGEFSGILSGSFENIKPALMAFAGELGVVGAEAIDGVDLTLASESIAALFDGLLSEEQLAGLAGMLEGMPELDPDAAAAQSELMAMAFDVLTAGLADGSLGLLDVAVFAGLAFDGMTQNITASSQAMLGASANASIASANAVVSEANAAISEIDSAKARALSMWSDFQETDLYKDVFGDIKVTPKPVSRPSYSSGYSGGSSSVRSQANEMISAWESVYNAILGSMEDLRDTILGTTQDSGNSFYESQFAILTAQARAGDEDAAKQLPEVVAQLSKYAQENSSSLFDQNSSIAGYIKSLEETQGYIAGLYQKAGGKLSDLEAWDTQSVYQAADVKPVNVPQKVIPTVDNSAMLNSLNSSSGNTALLAEFRAVRTELAAVKAELAAARSSAEDTAANTRNMSRTLDEVTNGGDAMITREVTA